MKNPIYQIDTLSLMKELPLYRFNPDNTNDFFCKSYGKWIRGCGDGTSFSDVNTISEETAKLKYPEAFK